MFDLFDLLVRQIFGNLAVAGIAIMALLIVIGVLSRMSIMLISTICILFLVMYFVPAYGGAIGVLFFFGSALYFVASIIPWVQGMLNR